MSDKMSKILIDKIERKYQDLLMVEPSRVPVIEQEILEMEKELEKLRSQQTMNGFTLEELKQFEKQLREYGMIEDTTEYLTKKFKKKIQKSIGLFLEPYNDSTDALIDIEFLFNRKFIIEKSDLAFDFYNIDEKVFLENIVEKSSFSMSVPDEDMSIQQGQLSASVEDFDSVLLRVKELADIIEQFVRRFGESDKRHAKYFSSKNLLS